MWVTYVPIDSFHTISEFIDSFPHDGGTRDYTYILWFSFAFALALRKEIPVFNDFPDNSRAYI